MLPFSAALDLTPRLRCPARGAAGSPPARVVLFATPESRGGSSTCRQVGAAGQCPAAVLHASALTGWRSRSRPRGEEKCYDPRSCPPRGSKRPPPRGVARVGRWRDRSRHRSRQRGGAGATALATLVPERGGAGATALAPRSAVQCRRPRRRSARRSSSRRGSPTRRRSRRSSRRTTAARPAAAGLRWRLREKRGRENFLRNTSQGQR